MEVETVAKGMVVDMSVEGEISELSVGGRIFTIIYGVQVFSSDALDPFSRISHKNALRNSSSEVTGLFC